MAGTGRGWREETRSGRRHFLVGNAMLHGKYAAARYGFGQHGAVSGDPGAATGHAGCRVCGSLAGRGAATAWSQQGSAGRSAGWNLAAGNTGATQAHVYIAVGRMATRTAAAPGGRELRGPGSGAGAALARAGSSRSMGSISGGADVVVAAVVTLRAERMVRANLVAARQVARG